MEDKKQVLLNLIAIGSFILYGLGIYLYVQIYGEWGNIAVDFAIQVLGPLLGVIIVAFFGSMVLLLTYYIQKFRKTNVFLCWFWIFSLYQCAINTFLQISGLPDEPINQFFKWLFPGFWYPAKEVFFLIISLIITYIWVKKLSKDDFKRIDVTLIAVAALILVGGTVISQIFLLN